MTDIVGMIGISLFLFDDFLSYLAAFLKSELSRISPLVEMETVPGIEKLTGDSSKVEKERVMEIFKDG